MAGDWRQLWKIHNNGGGKNGSGNTQWQWQQRQQQRHKHEGKHKHKRTNKQPAALSIMYLCWKATTHWQLYCPCSHACVCAYIKDTISAQLSALMSSWISESLFAPPRTYRIRLLAPKIPAPCLLFLWQKVPRNHNDNHGTSSRTHERYSKESWRNIYIISIMIRLNNK